MTGKPSGLPPASLYIHVPFCSKKCPYCHFFVLPDSSDNQAFFLKALHKEWLLKAPLFAEKEIVSIYFGGGTPSLLPASAIEMILDWVKKGPAPISPHVEITLEANPEKTDKASMQNFLKAGINRISLGIQSFDDNLLKTLGRTHGSLQAKQAVLSVFEAGIKNISIDLMYELPNQTTAQWEHSVREATTLPITHLSLYNLVFEPGTVFYKKKDLLSKNLPDNDEALTMLNFAVDHFTAKNLHRYEISAFALKGFHSVHNTGYWTARPFLGLGPSAFSYFEGRRFRNVPHLKKWASFLEEGKPSEDFEEKLDPAASQRELFAVEIRLLEGVNLSLFEKNNGPLFSELKDSIASLLSKGLLKKQGPQISLTEEGLKFYDSVAIELI